MSLLRQGTFSGPNNAEPADPGAVGQGCSGCHRVIGPPRVVCMEVMGSPVLHRRWRTMGERQGRRLRVTLMA